MKTPGKISCILLLVALVVALAPARSAHAATTWTVTKRTDSNDGVCDADCSLREAVAAAAVSGDTIVFAPGLAGMTFSLDLGPLTLSKSLTIDGSSLASHAQISGNNAVTIFHVVAPVSVSFKHLNLINGNGNISGYGGAIFAPAGGASLTINYVNFSANRSPAGRGGAIYLNPGVTANISNSSFTGNYGSSFPVYGGAIYSQYSLFVDSTTFESNANGGSAVGGGIYVAGGTAVVTNSTFFSNGGGSGTGSGIANYGALTLKNSTFQANWDSGALANNSSAVVYNTILINTHNGPDCVGAGFAASGGNIIGTLTGCTAPYSNSGAGIGAIGDYGGPTRTIPITTSSAAYNTGIVAQCPATDQRGVARPQNGTCDIGAFELDNTGPSVTLNQAAGQSDPATSLPVNFTAVFSEPIVPATFTAADITQLATASVGAWSVTDSGDHLTFTVAATDSTPGSIRPSIPAVTVTDIALNPNSPSSSTDDFVVYCLSSVSVANTNDAGAGSLRKAIDDLCPGGTITFDSDLAGQTITLGSRLIITKAMTIDGSSLSSHVRISGNDASNIFTLNAPVALTLRALDLIHGYAVTTGYGGAVYVGTAGASLNADSLNIEDNRAPGNRGGAISLQAGTSATINGSTFTHNGSGSPFIYGAAIENWAASLTVTDSTFQSNATESGTAGGGIYQGGGGTTLVTGSTFVSNGDVGWGGGALQNDFGTLSVANSTFVANRGSAIMNGSTAYIYNSTISDTISIGNGALQNSGNTTVYNTILVGTSGGPDCYGAAFVAGAANIIQSRNGCNPSDYFSSPMLGPLADNGGPTHTRAIQYGSIAIDHGVGAVCAAPPVNNIDQRGVARTFSTLCDIGAYEYNNYPPTDIALSNSSLPESEPAGTTVGTLTTTDPDSATFTYSIACASPAPDDASFQIGGAGGEALQTSALLDYESQSSYTLCVRSTDGSGAPYDENFTITLTDVNEPPTVALSNTLTSLPEDTDTSSAVKVADIVVTDDALGSNVVYLDGDDATMFQIIGPVLYIASGTALDYETNPVLDVTVLVDDPSVGITPDDGTPFSLNVTDVNEPPSVALTNPVASLPEDTDTSSAIKVADIVVTDDALGSNAVYLLGDDETRFQIIGSSLYIAAGAALDYETNPTLDVTVLVDDPSVGITPDDGAPFSLNVTDVNEPPSVGLANTVSSLPEDTDTTSTVKVADAVVTDDGLGTNYLSLSGTDSALFELDGTVLNLKAGTILDYETNPTLDVTVEVNDAAVGLTPDDSEALSITIIDANEPPSVALTNTTTLLPENTDTSSALKVADVVVTDDALGVNDLTLAGADAGLFQLEGAVLNLKLGAALDYETNPALDVTVEVNDAAIGATPDDTASLSIQVADGNDAPTGLWLSNNTVAEGQPAGAVVGTLTTSDVDAGDTFTYSLTCLTPGPDDGAFQISGDELQTAWEFDFEAIHSYFLCIRTTDSGGATFDGAFSVTVLDAPNAVMTVLSSGDKDGWVRESRQGSGVGGSTNTLATTFMLGDDAYARQYRGVLSFNTSALPDNAIVTGARLSLQLQGINGTNPYDWGGELLVDAQPGVMGALRTLEKSDFEFTAAYMGLGSIPDTNPGVGGWYSVDLPASPNGYDYVSPMAYTQLRLRFATPSNGGSVADRLKFYSGNAVKVSRPQLIITYALPAATLNFVSTASADGWVRESLEGSGAGGAVNNLNTTIIAGDDTANRQYVAILSFDTSSLPDTALIRSVTLKVKQQSNKGTPFADLGSLRVDVHKPYFGLSPKLQSEDFAFTPDCPQVVSLPTAPDPSGWYVVTLPADAFEVLNLSGTTQLRLRFDTPSDGDLLVDQVRLFSGNALMSQRPILIVDYAIP